MIKSTYKPFRSVPKDKDFEKVDTMRKHLGLRSIRSGNRSCLKCDDMFFSYDLCNEKICLKCKESPTRGE